MDPPSTTNGVGRVDSQGVKVESRGSRRSVVFSKIKNPPPPVQTNLQAVGANLNGCSSTQISTKQQQLVAVALSDKQLNSASLVSGSGQKGQSHYLQQQNTDGISQFNQQLQPGRQIKLVQQQLNPVGTTHHQHHRLNPPNTVKLSKNNIKNLGALPKAVSNLGQQTLTMFQQQQQVITSQSGRMMLMQPNNGIGMATPGGFTILANGQPSQLDQRTNALKPLNYIQNGSSGSNMPHEQEQASSKLEINLQQFANQSQQIFQLNSAVSNQSVHGSQSNQNSIQPTRIQKQASSSMVNGSVQQQQNQQMRFQLNSKRFSNVKDSQLNSNVGHQSVSSKANQHLFSTHQTQQQQYSQSVMRNHVRLTKKGNSNNMAQQQFYDIQGVSSGVTSQNGTMQNFNKTMNNFVSNQNLNLNGQKLLISSSQAPVSSSGQNQQIVQNQHSQGNLSNNITLQHLETTAPSSNQQNSKGATNEERSIDKKMLHIAEMNVPNGNSNHQVNNSANLTAQELQIMQLQSLHQKGSSNFQLQPHQSENNLDTRKIMIGLGVHNGRLAGQVVPSQVTNQHGQSLHTNHKQNQWSVIGESRPQSQNNKISGTHANNHQYTQAISQQHSQQFTQVQLNGIGSHYQHQNLQKSKQLNFSPGYSQQIAQQFNQEQYVMQQIMSKQQMHQIQQQQQQQPSQQQQASQVRNSSIGTQGSGYAQQQAHNGSKIQHSPGSSKANISSSQATQQQKLLSQQDLLLQQQSPSASQIHTGPQSAQKLLSMKHIQIQNARLANSQSDNNNSDNESSSAALNHQFQTNHYLNHCSQFSTQFQQGVTVSNGLSGVSPQQQQLMSQQPAVHQLGLTPQQKQEKLNLIRANSIQSQGGKFIKNQLSLLQKKQQSLEDHLTSNNEALSNDFILGSGMSSDSQWKNPDHICLTGIIKRDVSPGQQPQHMIHYDSQRQNRMINAGGSSPDTKLQNSVHQSGLALKNGEFGMTLEDDVESMLSDQFNTSNESMFKVRGVTASGQVQFGGGLAPGGAGDSTFRCNDSIQDEDRGLISESEDGWYAERDNPKNQEQGQNDNFDDISEHSSDEITDSENENPIPGDGTVKKTKKKGEKGERKKKKKKKADQQQIQSQNQVEMQAHDQNDVADRKLVQTYKKLEDATKDVSSKKIKQQEGKNEQKQSNQDQKKNVKKKDMNTTQIKVNLERKSKGGNDKTTGNQNNSAADQTNSKNLFASPNIKCKSDKQQATQMKQNTNNKKELGSQKNDKKQFMDDKEIAKQLAALDQVKNNSKDNSAATPLKKPKKNGLKLQALNHALPKNLQECYDRFFESGFKINPQFEYENASQAQKFLEQFVEPDGKYLEIAKKILDSFLKEYGSESNYLDCEGRKLDQDETHKYIKDYLQALGVEEWISINFQKNQVAPTSVTHDPKTGKCKMNIKLPCEYREGRMIGVLDHEIGTHFLRKHNEKLQQWYKKREKFDMKTCIATEEGLACTNQMVQTVKDANCKPFLYRSALNYYAAFMAKEMSFVDLFKDLEKYVDSPQARWKFTLRVKRGLSDTSQKGGLYKDQVYLEGAVKILQQRHTLNFKALLCGKISLDDYHREQIYSILNYEGQILPPFMEDMDDYLRCLDVIGNCNHILALDELSVDGDEVKDQKHTKITDFQDQQPQPIIDIPNSAANNDLQPDVVGNSDLPVDKLYTSQQQEEEKESHQIRQQYSNQINNLQNVANIDELQQQRDVQNGAVQALVLAMEQTERSAGGKCESSNANNYESSTTGTHHQQQVSSEVNQQMPITATQSNETDHEQTMIFLNKDFIQSQFKT